MRHDENIKKTKNTIRAKQDRAGSLLSLLIKEIIIIMTLTSWPN